VPDRAATAALILFTDFIPLSRGIGKETYNVLNKHIW
jgi:hypothetical protein